MRIRLADLEDVEQMAQNNILLAKESEGASVDYSISLSAVKAVISDKNKGFYVVAEENNQVVGQLMVTYEWSDWRNKMMWWIQSVYIKKDYRRKGVFKMLFGMVEEMARKNSVSVIRLYVHSENRDAARVYERIGMEKTPYLIYQKKVL